MREKETLLLLLGEKERMSCILDVYGASVSLFISLVRPPPPPPRRAAFPATLLLFLSYYQSLSLCMVYCSSVYL